MPWTSPCCWRVNCVSQRPMPSPNSFLPCPEMRNVRVAENSGVAPMDSRDHRVPRLDCLSGVSLMNPDLTSVSPCTTQLWGGAGGVERGVRGGKGGVGDRGGGVGRSWQGGPGDDIRQVKGILAGSDLDSPRHSELPVAVHVREGGGERLRLDYVAGREQRQQQEQQRAEHRGVG